MIDADTVDIRQFVPLISIFPIYCGTSVPGIATDSRDSNHRCTIAVLAVLQPRPGRSRRVGRVGITSFPGIPT